ASRVSHGRENDLWIELDGTRGSLEWHQEGPNRLWHRVHGLPHRLISREPSAEYMTASARASCRLPAGHPEGFLEAFANIYTAAFEDMIGRATGQPRLENRGLYPSVADGVAGVRFVAQCVASAGDGGVW